MYVSKRPDCNSTRLLTVLDLPKTLGVMNQYCNELATRPQNIMDLFEELDDVVFHIATHMVCQLPTKSWEVSLTFIEVGALEITKDAALATEIRMLSNAVQKKIHTSYLIFPWLVGPSTLIRWWPFHADQMVERIPTGSNVLRDCQRSSAEQLARRRCHSALH